MTRIYPLLAIFALAPLAGASAAPVTQALTVQAPTVQTGWDEQKPAPRPKPKPKPGPREGGEDEA